MYKIFSAQISMKNKNYDAQNVCQKKNLNPKSIPLYKIEGILKTMKKED